MTYNSKEITFLVDKTLQSIIFRLTGNILFRSQANNLFELFSDQLFITMLILWPWEVASEWSWQLTVWIQSTFTWFAFPWAGTIKPYQKEWALHLDLHLHKVWHKTFADLVATSTDIINLLCSVLKQNFQKSWQGFRNWGLVFKITGMIAFWIFFPIWGLFVWLVCCCVHGLLGPVLFCLLRGVKHGIWTYSLYFGDKGTLKRLIMINSYWFLRVRDKHFSDL